MRKEYTKVNWTDDKDQVIRENYKKNDGQGDSRNNWCASY